MKWFDDFLGDPLLSVTDKTDKSTLNNFRRTEDRSQGAKTGLSLTAKTDKSPDRELDDSAERLEASGIRIAIFDDGSMRVVVTETETVRAVKDKAAIYSPADMRAYVGLPEDERKVIHGFKKHFGGIFT